MVRFSLVRLAPPTLFLAALLTSACGESEPGFRIDDVRLSPDDLPYNSLSSEDIRISADVWNDRQEVLEVLVRSDEAPLLWLELLPGARYPKWSTTVPIVDFSQYAVGEYWLDFEARDSANRVVRLEDAVKLEIRDN